MSVLHGSRVRISDVLSATGPILSKCRAFNLDGKGASVRSRNCGRVFGNRLHELVEGQL